jgi:hypothetical protein
MTHVGQTIRFFSRAFRFAGRIGQGENDWSLINFRHRADHVLRKRVLYRRNTYKNMAITICKLSF